MISLFKRFFISSQQDFSREIGHINALEDEIRALSNEDITVRSNNLRKEIQNGKSTDECLPEAFALVREAARRTLGQRHFDVQLMGGIALHQGVIAEMATGEGKTLAATAPVYLNALSGMGVHVVTVNEYLSKRDAVWMGQIYHLLGMRVACLVHEGARAYDSEYSIDENVGALLDNERDATGSFRVQEEFLRPITRREAYQADIIYGTNHEFGFDYLRDNLAPSLDQQVQLRRPEGVGVPIKALGQVQNNLHYAIIDEVDSILIDEARTPLIISAPDTQSSEYYKVFARAVRSLIKDEDYEVDEKLRSVSILEDGIEKIEHMLGIRDLYSMENLRLVHFLEESLKAHALFRMDKEYVVKDGEIVIVDEFTGRLMHGRRYSGGLHQAIEAKEGIAVREESRTYAKISIQNYFRLYKKLAGMTGTAQTSAEEFHTVYGLDVITIPSNRPNQRTDMSDTVYKTADMKYRMVAEGVRQRHERGQPVLVGTASIEKNEVISGYLNEAGVPHEILNAKNNEREGAIIAQAGRRGAVTVATNMAGRGVDIVLGGNPLNIEEAKAIKTLGGLHVVGTDRHDARRIDDQLRGRTGRQGDPGSSQFFLSLEDDLLRIFGGGRVSKLMTTLNVPEDTPIDSKIISRVIRQAQAKVEGFNFDSRKHMLEYDDVLNKQRTAIYGRRQEIISTIQREDILRILSDIFSNALERNLEVLFQEELTKERLETFAHAVREAKIIENTEEFIAQADVSSREGGSVREKSQQKLNNFLATKIREKTGEAVADPHIRAKIISSLDMLWMGHLENIDALAESVRIRAYGQHDPLVEYRRESRRLFQDLLVNFEDWVFFNLLRIVSTETVGASTEAPAREKLVPKAPLPTGAKKVGRNDACPCGAKKSNGTPVKYKHCHGKNA